MSSEGRIAPLVACVLLGHFPLQVEVARNPRLRDVPVLIVGTNASQRVVLDASPGIKGVSPGMPLQEALARRRDARLIEGDMPEYEEAFNRVLRRLLDWSPDVERAGLGRAYVGLRGLLATYGSEERLTGGLLDVVSQGFTPRVGVAHGKFPAYLAALKAGVGSACKAPEPLDDFVGEFPVHVLPVPWKIRARLHGFGLRTLGDVANLDVGPLQAQFGSDGARMWALARGEDTTPLVPIGREETYTESVAFDSPVAGRETILLATDHLLGKLFALPELRGRYARMAFVQGSVPRRAPWGQRVTFKTPVGDRRTGYTLLRYVVEGATLPGPLEDLSLTLRGITGEAGRQESLFREVRRREQLDDAVRQMKRAFGHNPIMQVREVEPWSRIPERRNALVPYEP